MNLGGNRFDRAELAGAFGDLGTLVPFVVGYITIARLDPQTYEYQMLYGVRPGLQLDLARRGYKVLVATPFGPEWYPYLMRRLAERPANLGFFARNLLRR